MDFISLIFYKLISSFEKEKRKHSEWLSTLAAQVSHDIRSPLTALSSSAREWMHLLPEEERVTVRAQIQRIQDIANDLLRKRKEIQSGKGIGADEGTSMAPQMLSSCIEEMVTEKRMNFRQHLDLHIEAQVDQTYGIFANVNFTEFKRILSNLINNATEAYEDKKGVIKVILTEDDLNAIVSVTDMGNGIPPEVLTKLGACGITHGKEASSGSGNGLGIAHAKSTIESWGGRFTINSATGQGTTVTIVLPKTKAPHWFVSKIVLATEMTIVILDDDQGIHQTWDRRLASALANKEYFIKIVHLSTPLDFSAWVTSHHKTLNKVLYLCDYELLGYKESGLDLIAKHNLRNMAYLVTSHYEESKIRSRCKELEVKLIPKMLAGLVPIEFSASTEIGDTQAVLIDDDFYIRKDWTRQAKRLGVHFVAFETPTQFWAMSEQLSKENCEIYIDRELGDEFPKGEELATKLHEQGFQKITLATGYGASLFQHLPWLQVRGKEAPWILQEESW